MVKTPVKKTFLTWTIARFRTKNNRTPLAVSDASLIIKAEKPFILAKLDSDEEVVLFAVKFSQPNYVETLIHKMKPYYLDLEKISKLPLKA